MGMKDVHEEWQGFGVSVAEWHEGGIGSGRLEGVDNVSNASQNVVG